MKLLSDIFDDGTSRIGIWESETGNGEGSLQNGMRGSGASSQVLSCLRMFPGLENSYIVYDKNGKPYLNESTRGKISLSHSHGMLAIIHDRKSETGIDLEKVGDKVIRIRHKFLHPDELSACGAQPDARALHIYWGAKEALYKCYGKRSLHFSENLRVEAFTTETEGEVRGEIRVAGISRIKKLYYRFMGHYLLVYIRNS
ncbi:MAG: 4'-phosphopantetheinyl transferase superfamily protein [Bacteroidia bacterium]|nr:4'-phosphopantetheinyl transferase superfamily protein [Bacteroidia bacterium]